MLVLGSSWCKRTWVLLTKSKNHRSIPKSGLFFPEFFTLTNNLLINLIYTPPSLIHQPTIQPVAAGGPGLLQQLGANLSWDESEMGNGMMQIDISYQN